MRFTITDSTTPAPAPQAPDFDATAANIVGTSCRAASSDAELANMIAAALWGAYDGGQRVAIANNSRQPSPELAALIGAARAYAIHYTLDGTSKPTYATEHAIDAVLDACRALFESEAANG